MNIAVFASHGGSDLQAIIDGCNNHAIDAKVVVVISNNSDLMALQRAAKENIPIMMKTNKSQLDEKIMHR